MLYRQIKGYEFIKPIQGKIGTLIGIVFNADKWLVTHFVISHGMGKAGKGLISERFIKEFDTDQNKIILSEDHAEDEIPTSSTKTQFMCKDFIGKKVVSSDGTKVGKIYDLDIPEKLKVWKVWKIMIKTGIKKRRLRISPGEIRSITPTEVVLRKEFGEIFPSTE